MEAQGAGGLAVSAALLDGYSFASCHCMGGHHERSFTKIPVRLDGAEQLQSRHRSHHSCRGYHLLDERRARFQGSNVIPWDKTAGLVVDLCSLDRGFGVEDEQMTRSTEAAVRDAFAEQAKACAERGSPFTGRLC